MSRYQLVRALPGNDSFDSTKEDELHHSANQIQTTNFKTNFIYVARTGSQMALSYTFSFSVVAVGIMGNWLDDSEQHAAAVILSQNLMNSILNSIQAPAFALSVMGTITVGKLRFAMSNNRSDAQHKKRLVDILRSGAVMTCVLAPIGFLSLFFSKPTLMLFKQDLTVIHITEPFLRIIAFIPPAILSRMCFEQIMFSFGLARPAMIISLINFSIGSLMAGLLGFGVPVLGIPRLGLSGIAIGYVIESYLTAMCYGLYVKYGRELKEIAFFSKKNFDPTILFKRLKKLIRIGGATTTTFVTDMLALSLMGVFAGSISVEGQASLTFVMQLMFFLYIPFSAFGQTTSQEVGRLIGARNYHQARTLARHGLVTTLILVVPPCIVSAAIPNVIRHSLGNDDENLNDTVSGLSPIMSTAVTLEAVRYNLLWVLRVCGDVRGSALISVGTVWLGVALSAGLGLGTNLGIYGIPTGYAIGLAASCVGLFYRWHQRLKPEALQIQANQTEVQSSQPAQSTWRSYLTSWLPSSWRTPPRHSVPPAFNTLWLPHESPDDDVKLVTRGLTHSENN